MELLKFYGPNVPEKYILQIAHLFAELRSLVDRGLLNYPYSTRYVYKQFSQSDSKVTDNQIIQRVS